MYDLNTYPTFISRSLGYSTSTDHFPGLHRLSVPNSHRSSDDVGDGNLGGILARYLFGYNNLMLATNLIKDRKNTYM